MLQSLSNILNSCSSGWIVSARLQKGRRAYVHLRLAHIFWRIASIGDVPVKRHLHDSQVPFMGRADNKVTDSS